VRIQLTLRSPQKSPAKKSVTAEWLRVGRNASCEIHLPDPRVALEQGMIVNRDGLVYIEGEAGSQNITRKSVRSVRMLPGVPIEVGPYRITAQAPPKGFDAALVVEMARPLEAGEDFVSRNRAFTLARLGLTKRWAAWAWGLAVLVAFLALPAARVLHLPWSPWAPALGADDRLWNPGPVMLAHQPIAQRCDACHEVAFRHVRDTACLECHSRIGQHVGPEMKPVSLFEGARCTECHRDHKGVKSTHRDDDRFCVDCHRDVKAKSKEATVANAADFARDHPAFTLSLPTGSGVRRVRQGAGPIAEQPHLAFPHATHLDPKGVRSPLQGRMKLDCSSCHQPDASKRGFEPISMAKHCQECHQLQFEPAVTTREVPHGKPAEVMQVVDEFYSSLALRGTPDSFQKAFGVPGEGLLRRPGAGSGQREDALRMASRKATQVADEIFQKRVCATCHEVSRQDEQWRIEPLHLPRTWMPAARFDHRSHGQAKCASCHDVATSKKASDVAMPAIARCRECHGGSLPVEGKLTSNCLLCHNFHDARHLWDPNFRPRNPARVAQENPGAR
jgi:predicted CXXCH cytochrome family protein